MSIIFIIGSSNGIKGGIVHLMDTVGNVNNVVSITVNWVFYSNDEMLLQLTR